MLYVIIIIGLFPVYIVPYFQTRLCSSKTLLETTKFWRNHCIIIWKNVFNRWQHMTVGNVNADIFYDLLFLVSVMEFVNSFHQVLNTVATRGRSRNEPRGNFEGGSSGFKFSNLGMLSLCMKSVSFQIIGVLKDVRVFYTTVLRDQNCFDVDFATVQNR